MLFYLLFLACIPGLLWYFYLMKKKVHNIGTISDRELKKRVRKQLPPPPQKHRSAKDYRRNPKHKNENE